MSLIFQVFTVVLTIGAAWAISVVLLAWARVRPPRLTDARALVFLKRLSPDDLSLPFEVLQFQVPQHGESGAMIRLAAWFVPHAEAAGRTVILLHGYSDAKIGSAAWLPLLHDLKWNVLLLDLPAHGESEGTITTAGWYERHQVRAVLQQLEQKHSDACRHVVLFGISQGAAVALATADVDPTVAGVIADSPFADIRKAAVLHAALFGLPGAFLQIPAGWLIEHALKIRYGEIAPIRLLREIRCPVLLISSGRDALVSHEDAELMKDAVYAKGHRDGASAVLAIPTAPHILGLATDPEGYRQAICKFLAATLRDNGTEG
jgi:uncharacterized protein